jgi:plastocyanin
MRKIIALATVAVASAALAVPAFGATKTVNVGDIWFISKAKNKGTVTVKKGTKVTWKWVGKFPHTVTVKSGPVKFTSKKLTKGTYSQTLKKPGTYKIYCKVHTAAAQAMTLKVTA